MEVQQGAGLPLAFRSRDLDDQDLEIHLDVQNGWQETLCRFRYGVPTYRT